MTELGINAKVTSIITAFLRPIAAQGGPAGFSFSLATLLEDKLSAGEYEGLFQLGKCVEDSMRALGLLDECHSGTFDLELHDTDVDISVEWK